MVLCVYTTALKPDIYTCRLENPRIAMAVALSKGFHHAVNFLGFSRQPKAPQELSVKGHNSAVSNTLTFCVKRLIFYFFS